MANNNNSDDEFIAIFKSVSKYVLFLILGVLVLIFLFGSFYIVSAGERGVVSTFGNPDMTAKAEGLHFKMPIIQSVTIFDIKTQKYEADATAASSDLQNVQVKLAINYHLQGEAVPALFKEVGADYSIRIIQPMEQEVVKASTALFTAEELITKREQVRDIIKWYQNLQIL